MKVLFCQQSNQSQLEQKETIKELKCKFKLRIYSLKADNTETKVPNNPFIPVSYATSSRLHKLKPSIPQQKVSINLK